MQKVDIAIAVIGAVALLTTGLGIAFYDEFSGQDDYTVALSETAYAEQGGAVGTTPTTFTFEAPNNTYGSSFEIVVAFTNQNPAITGTVTVTATLQGLKADQSVECNGSAQLSAGSLTLTCEDEGWVELPEDGKYSEEDAEATTPGGDVTLTVTVSGPGSPLPIGPNPTYAATINGDALTYALAKENADPEAI